MESRHYGQTCICSDLHSKLQMTNIHTENQETRRKQTQKAFCELFMEIYSMKMESWSGSCPSSGF